MGILQAMLLGIALGTDSFSISVGIGMKRLNWKSVLRVSLLFSMSQVILLIVGFYFTLVFEPLFTMLPLLRHLEPEALCNAIQQVFTWLGAAILAGLGVNMLVSFFKPGNHGQVVCYSGRLGLLALALTVSIDALTAGFGLGFLDGVALSLTTIVVGMVIFLMAVVGLLMGKQINRWFGKNVTLVGGMLMVYLAIYFVWQNLL